MQVQYILVPEGGKIVVRCPRCGRSKSGPAQQLNHRRSMTIECTCTYVFGIHIEFRNRFRKATALNGFVETISKEERWAKLAWQSVSPESHSVNCSVQNISLKGIGLRTFRDFFFREGDFLKIGFNLDDSASSRIMKKAVVRVVKDKYVGCEFFEEDQSDPKIGFYLL